MEKFKNLLLCLGITVLIICMGTWECDFLEVSIRQNKIEKMMRPIDLAYIQGEIEWEEYQDMKDIIETAANSSQEEYIDVNSMLLQYKEGIIP